MQNIQQGYTPKLVRDRIPEIIAAKGEHAEWRQAKSQHEHREMLSLKLTEELDEYMKSNSQEERTEELADVSEVIHSFVAVDDYLECHAERVRLAKKSQAETSRVGSGDAVLERFCVLRDELSLTPGSSERLEKLAGLLQCVYDFAGIDGIKQDDVEALRIQKKEKRGSFIGGIVLLNW